MQRLAPELVGNAPLIDARERLKARTQELLTDGAAVFDLAREFDPTNIRRIAVASRIGGVCTDIDGNRSLHIPEQPVEYALEAVVLPGLRFTHPKSQAEVSRRAALNMSVTYDWQKQSGVDQGLPTPTPAPDSIVFKSKPISLDGPRYQDPQSAVTVPTISGDYVSVYDRETWEPLDLPNYHRFPTASKDEMKDWGAFVEYPPESLNEAMIDYHTTSADWFLKQLEIVKIALVDPDLNPRPAIK